MDKEFDQLRQTLGQNVRSLRLGRGLSQEQLAFDAEIDRTYVSQIERAVINPSLQVLYRVSTVLGVEVIQLLTPPNPET